MSEDVHRGIIQKLANAGEDLQQIKSIIDNEPQLRKYNRRV
jgi:hypothetical protein